MPPTSKPSPARSAWPATWIQIYESVAPTRLKQLSDMILAWSTQYKSAPSKNVGGWKSSETLFAIDNPAVHELAQEIRTLVYAFTPVADYFKHDWSGDLHGWAMVNYRGAEHPRHTHHRTIATGIYYVDPGTDDPLDGTPTLFEATEKDVTRAEVQSDGTIPGVTVDRDANDLGIAPLPGRLVLFPGSVWHRVPKVIGTRPRITIAFDVRA